MPVQTLTGELGILSPSPTSGSDDLTIGTVAVTPSPAS